MQTKSGMAYRDAATQYVAVRGMRLAYRWIGTAEGTPLVLLNHWGANLDNFDPRIVEGLGHGRPVLALDYAGIGGSEGPVRDTVAAMAADMIAVIRTLSTGPVDVFGFSLGGFVAQQIALDEPALVRRLILAGTGPAGGTGGETIIGVTMQAFLKAALTLRDPKYYLFFTQSKAGQSAAKAFLARLRERTADRDKTVGLPAFLKQLGAIKAWSRQAPQPLETITIPVLVANGDSDAMVPSENSRDMARRIANAELVLYPNAGHGGIFQYHQQFIEKARAFLG